MYGLNDTYSIIKINYLHFLKNADNWEAISKYTDVVLVYLLLT